MHQMTENDGYHKQLSDTKHRSLLVSRPGVERWHVGHSASGNKQTREVIKSRKCFFSLDKGEDGGGTDTE